MAKKILVTAFEPFGGRTDNPTLRVLAALKAPPGARLFRARLPVEGRAVGKKIETLLARLKPDLLVSLGLAAGEAAVRVERFGLNVADYGIKDNAGWRPEGEKLDPSGPAAYTVTIDPRRLAAAARRAGAPAYVSNHAGGYVCNTLMYRAMRAIDRAGLRTRYAFIHIPVSTGMALKEKPGKNISSSLPLALMTAAVQAAIKEAAK
ncbi:MAG: pyrrolidone-carboxylate peptidase [Elusimicrobia bacterium]|nr:MAG: pyrrolidone-carboxylate peptidase [Elusimicrobiota bacterium]KAF0153169.1 MAG: pyrrolidone-carboxylate peptidase [Elusimicrobiota bacterium]